MAGRLIIAAFVVTLGALDGSGDLDAVNHIHLRRQTSDWTPVEDWAFCFAVAIFGAVASSAASVTIVADGPPSAVAALSAFERGQNPEQNSL